MRLVLTILIISFFALTFAMLGKSDIFEISETLCKTQYGPCQKEDEERLLKFKGENLFILSSDTVKDSLRQNFKNRRVFIHKIFPWTLEAVLEKRKPIVAVNKFISDDNLFLVDKDGFVVDLVDKSFLPVLIFDENTNLVVGEKMSDYESRAVELFYSNTQVQEVRTGKYEGGDLLIVELNDGIRIIYPLTDDYQVLIGALQLILTRSRIDGKIPREIDLRFTNPVLRY